MIDSIFPTPTTGAVAGPTAAPAVPAMTDHAAVQFGQSLVPLATRIAKAQTLSLSANKPVALLLCRDLMWEEA